MNKLSFRARALDANKPMAVHRPEDVPDLQEFTSVGGINRSVPQMPSGMEKEEETEHHLQRALSAQQCYGTAQQLAIPIPEVGEDLQKYERLYLSNFKQPKQYIHIQALGFEKEMPDYDLDSEDEDWLNRQAKKMELTPLQFEEMMDRLEKSSGQQVLQLNEAKLLLKEDDDLIIAVYDYWLNKKLRMQHPLISEVKTEKRDGTSNNNPYVAFRRRTEKMQTRKNRKNDEVSYQMMLKLRRDISKALTLLDFLKRREKTKKELIQLELETAEKRNELRDADGRHLAEAEAQKRLQQPSYTNLQRIAEDKKRSRENRKRKHRLSVSEADNFAETHDYRQWEESRQNAREPLEVEDPDGVYAFRRKEGCNYLPARDWEGVLGASASPEAAVPTKYRRNARYSLCQIRHPRRCVGYARRRTGRGGRVMLDRGVTEYDRMLRNMDLDSDSEGAKMADEAYSQFADHVKTNNLPYFQPASETSQQRMLPPVARQQSVGGGGYPYTPQQQPTRLLSSASIPSSLSSPIVSHLLVHGNLPAKPAHAPSSVASFTAHNAFLSPHPASTAVSLLQPRSPRVSRAADAVLESAALALASRGASEPRVPPSLASSASSTPAGPNGTLHNGSTTNGPLSDATKGLSTSPAASVLQLNFPLTTSGGSAPSTSGTATSSPKLPSVLTAAVQKTGGLTGGNGANTTKSLLLQHNKKQSILTPRTKLGDVT